VISIKLSSMTSAMPRVTINLNKLRFPIHAFFFCENSLKKFYNLIFLFYGFFSYDLYTYFIYAATASTITDDVTKLVMHRVFNTNCGTSFTHI